MSIGRSLPRCKKATCSCQWWEPVGTRVGLAMLNTLRMIVIAGEAAMDFGNLLLEPIRAPSAAVLWCSRSEATGVSYLGDMIWIVGAASLVIDDFMTPIYNSMKCGGSIVPDLMRGHRPCPGERTITIRAGGCDNDH